MINKLYFLIIISSSLLTFSCQHIHSKYFHSKNSYKKESCSKQACKYKKACSKKACKYKNKNCFSESCSMRHSLVGLAEITGVNNNSIKGSISFEKEKPYAVRVNASLKGLKPNQQFGFHVHEFGTCSNKALMAGSHLNPKKAKHGAPKDRERHLGDLGNLVTDEKGTAEMSIVIKGKIKMFMGRSVVVHEGKDDLKSQPAGNSGKRIACGVIGVGISPVILKNVEPAKADKASNTKAIRQTKATAQKAKQADTMKATVQKAKQADTMKATVQKAKQADTMKATAQKAGQANTMKATAQKAKQADTMKATAQKAKQADTMKATAQKAGQADTTKATAQKAGQANTTKATVQKAGQADTTKANTEQKKETAMYPSTN